VSRQPKIPRASKRFIHTCRKDTGDPAYTTEYQYDSLGRVVEEIQPDPDDFSHRVGGLDGPLSRPTTAYAYDEFGNLASATDPLGNITTYHYDKLGRAVAATDALGNTSTVLYDAAGNVLLSTDALGRVVQTEYDSMNRPVRVTLPKPDDSVENLAATTTYQYDLGGNLTSTTGRESRHVAPPASNPQSPTPRSCLRVERRQRVVHGCGAA
jgi:YD repeat-containing protein